MNTRFRASKDVDDLTTRLHLDLDLSSKGRMVRLAVGRSLGLGPFLDTDVEGDSKGQEVPARAIFKDDDIEVWLGLLVAHAQLCGLPNIDTLDSLRLILRRHWTRGVHALWDDWEASEQNYDNFVVSLITRRAHLSVPKAVTSASEQGKAAAASPTDASDQVAKALREIGVDAEVRGEPIHGPRVTRYRIYLKDVNQIGPLERKLKEISLSLNLQAGAPSISKGDEAKVVFLAVPRARSSWHPVGRDAFSVWVKTLPQKNRLSLSVFLGLDELGKPFDLPLVDCPHLFVGGTTGSGKSVCLHAIITSLIATQSSATMQLALIDTKQVELTAYSTYPNLYRGEIAYDSNAAVELLDELVVEMESRYSLFRQRGVNSFDEAMQLGMALPRVVVVVEELADLLLSKKAAEQALITLAQKARAAGIHLVLSTQRPDAKTFSGLLRSNIPSRIALTVQKSTESSIILDETGAENLLGAGDMLVKANGQQTKRVHGVNLTRDDITAALRTIRA
jgi:S-DNA-T family DNA segregation ATPase FtsK/SpoIIIE